MAWYDTAPIPPPEAVRRLGDVLEVRGTPLGETAPKDKRRRHQVYQTLTSVGEVGVTVSVDGWHVFFSPWGTRRFMNIWDWKECALGEPRPKGRELPLEESVEWVLGLLEKNRPPEVDLECVERAGRELDRRVARDRWLGPLKTFGLYAVLIGVLIWSGVTGSTGGVIVGSICLAQLVGAKVRDFFCRLFGRKK